MKKVTAFLIMLFISPISNAAFEGSDVPISIKALYCDSNPRIVVQFADASKNVWFPANSGDSSKTFLSLALTAKASSLRLYYYGVGNATDLTTYCVNVSARQVTFFGIE